MAQSGSANFGDIQARNEVYQNWWYESVAAYVSELEANRNQLQRAVYELEGRVSVLSEKDKDQRIKIKLLFIENLGLKDELRNMHSDCKRRYGELNQKMLESQLEVRNLQADLVLAEAKIDAYAKRFGPIQTPSLSSECSDANSQTN